MDLNLKTESIKYMEMVYEGRFSHEETAEMIVPDALPDILNILDTEATVLMRSKEAENGRLKITGIVELSVLYSPDGDVRVQKLSMNIPFTSRTDADGITEDCDIIASVSIGNISVDAVNPRKIIAKADIETNAECFIQSEMTVSTALSDEDKDRVENLGGSAERTAVTLVSEKTFVVSDEYIISGAKPAVGEILSANSKITVDEAKNVGNKLIYSGKAFTKVLYFQNEGKDIESAEFTTAFSQIMELGTADENTDFNVSVMMTGMYIDAVAGSADGGRNILLELHAVAQCKAVKKTDITYLSDVYSIKNSLDVQKREEQIYCSLETVKSDVFLRETIKTSDDVKRVINAKCCSLQPMQSWDNGDMTVSAGVNVKILYETADGKVRAVSQKFKAEAVTEYESSCEYRIKMVDCEDLYVSVGGDGFDVRLTVNFYTEKGLKMGINCIHAISYDENAVIDISGRPSVILHRLKAGETMWELSKRYISSEALIRQANGLEEKGEIKENTLLLIPRKRQ